MRRNLPPKENFIGQTIDRFPDYVIKEHIDSGANGHVFRAYSEPMNRSLAFKVIPVGNLVTDEEKEQYLGEARQANILENQSVVGYIDYVDYIDPGSNTPCVVFVCDFIDGPSLAKYLDDNANRTNIDLSFIRKFLDTMLLLLLELQAREYQHGDLHAGNILVVESRYDIDERMVFKVTDFGVRNLTASRQADDFGNIATILNTLLEFIDFREASGLDKFVFNAMRDRFMKRYLLEADPMADEVARNPREMLRRLRALEEEYRKSQISDLDDKSLVTPFDYPNCEQIGDSHLLLQALYSNRLLELGAIEAHSNVVLTGPRGCGKTTVFRALSLQYLLSTGQDAPDKIHYIGVYYRCDDLYFSFPRYENLEREDAVDIPMHFMIVTLLLLLLRQIEPWAIRNYAEEWNLHATAMVDELWALFEWPIPTGPDGRDTATLMRRLDKERSRARKTYRFARNPDQNLTGFFGPGAMFDACKIIRSSFSFLKNRTFHFYIDDYSHPKITVDLQANLNRMLVHRNPDAFFKISTESPVSFVQHDMDQKNFAEAREYEFINLGVRYITDKTGQTFEFIKDLFERRFQKADYPAKNLKELLDSCPRNDNARARVLRRDLGEEEGKYRYLFGEEVISLMCSGDIHHMIRLVRRMVDDFGGIESLTKSGSLRPIPPHNQHQSIRNEAGAVMESIRTVPEVGPKLANVVAAFGKVAQSYLQHKNSRNEQGNPPHQASKIEPYEALDLGEEAEKIRHELLRYSVFIEDPKGKSRRGNVVPRFFLRRSLVPHFRLTFSQRDSVELENVDIELLLMDPDGFERKFRIKGSEDSHVDDQTGDLFDER